MPYTITYGVDDNAKSVSGLDTETVVTEAHRLHDGGIRDFQITDEKGESYSLHNLELALELVDVRAV